MHITNEQKQAANQIDLVAYLESKGYEMVKRGSSYKINLHGKKFPGDMSSLSIFENRRGWKRWSTGEHGGDAISFLEKNMGMDFQNAVIELTGNNYSSFSNVTKPCKTTEYQDNKPLKLPEKANGKYSRLFAYLTKTRMIDACIVTKMLADNKIYQDKNGNVVFVGYDEKSEPKFACVRGTNTDKVFKGDCDGSDKRYAFSVEGSNTSKLYVFEAPIDLLSHATMANRYTKNNNAWTLHTRLCLAGTSDVALEHYLKTHSNIKELHFCLDNDDAGQSAAKKHCEKYTSLGYKTINHCPKHNDMNDDLVAYSTGEPPPKKTAAYIMHR